MNRPLALAGVGVVFVALAVVVACSSSSSGAGASDAGAVDSSCDPIDSQCGQPCQAGNSLGVGQFCNNITDCSQTPNAHLCSSLGSLSTHFCTFRCMAPDAALPEGGGGFPTSCGTGASCTCDNSGNCGCTPNTCLGK
jgi:hypothetical protein